MELRGRPFEGLACAVLASDGRPQTLGDVVAKRPAVIVFLRHFGCVGCEMQVTSLMPRQLELTDLGVRLVLVGSGSRAHALAFIERWGLDERRVVVVTDPGLKAFRAAGLVRSAWATFGPRALLSELVAIGAGQRPRRADGDRFQQGGTLLLDATGSVVFVHANRFVGDVVDAAELVDAATRLHLRSLETAADGFARRGII